MAKLKYNEGLVNSTIDELGAASNQLITTEEEMHSALSIIANAQGIHHVHTDTLFNTLGFPAACQEMIEETITSLKNRAAEIEAYNEEYENASFLEKLGSTAGLFLTKICEGFASAGEQIVDGFASVLGLGVGLVSKDAQNSIANFIKKDHVGDFFDNLYDNSLKGMVIRSWASEKGLACNIFKGVGTGLGYAAALAAGGAIAGGVSTGTLAGAKVGAATLMSSLPAAATVAGIAGTGAGTQAGLQGGLDYGDAFAYGLKYGAIQAGTTVVFSLAFKALAKGWNLLKTKIKGTPNSTSLTVVNNNGTTGGTSGAGTPPGGTPPTGGTGGAGGAAAPKTGVFKQAYQAGNGKAYTCLDDVWDDVVGGNLTKSQLRDIIKNTVGIQDGGVGHTFMSDALNVMKGTPPSTVGWRTVAEQMAGTTDDTMAAAAGNMTNASGPATASGNPMGSTVADDMFTGSSSSTSTQLSTKLANTTTGSTLDDTVAATLDDTIGTVTDDMFTGSSSSTSTQLSTKLANTTTGSTLDDTVAATLDDTIGAGLDDTVATVSHQKLSGINRSMEKISEKLYNAQHALDDAIAQGADDATLAPLRQTVDDLTSALKVKQQAYVDATSSGQFNKIGTEGKYKLIIGDDVVAGGNSTPGDITTMRVGTTNANGTVEYRPNWTDATAKAEGQINAKEFAKLLDDQYGKVVPTPAPTAPPTALATIGPTALATIPPKGPTGLATIPPKGPTALTTIAPTAAPITALATVGPTGLATIPPKGPTALATIPPKGPTAIVPTVTPGPIVTIAPTVSIVPTIVPTVTIAPTIAPPITPVKGDTIIFGVVEPKEIVPTPSITITPAPVIPITTPPITTPPIIITTPPVITTPPPVITTPPPVITTPPIVITTPPPVITTPPVVITTPPPVAVTTAPPIVTTPPPIDEEYVPIPNTGIGGSSISKGFGPAPVVAGAVAGIAGIVGGSLLRGSSKDKKEKEEEESEE